jgi:diguanylate cyclase
MMDQRVADRVERPSLSLADHVLGTEAHQRIRLVQCAVASLLMLSSTLAMVYLVWVDIAPATPVAWWALASLLGFAGFFALIRSGVNRRFADPSLTLAQMCFAFVSGAVAYSIAGRGRGAAFPILMVIMMFGMTSLTARQVRLVSVVAVALFGSAMALMAWRRPEVYEPAVELGHFLMIGVMLPAVAWLAGQMNRLRQRLKDQKSELARAVTRIRELATRDELTGLANRRHMTELLELERQRCVRSGQTFCIALIDLDHFKHVNDEHGHDAGDAMLAAWVREAAEGLRLADILARWGGESFLLLMSDTRAPLARMGVERMRARTGRLRVPRGSAEMTVTMSAGIVEHHAGELVADAVARAEQGLAEAKRSGRNRIAMA